MMFFLLALLALYAPSDSYANDSWQRGFAIVPVLFILAVAITWACGRYLLSKGFAKPVHFITGAFGLIAGLVAVLVTPAIIVGTVIGFFPLGSSILTGLIVPLIVAVASLQSAVIWWWIVAHN
jgi:hypothetical protein